MKTLILILVLSFAAFGQSPNQWHGLILDEATPEKAIADLGNPKTDKDGQGYRPLKFNEWFDVKEKNFRVLHYENNAKIEGFKDVKLTFRGGKLVSILLEPEKLAANALSRAYNLEFNYLNRNIDEAFNPNNFERNQGKVYPKSYPTVYFLGHKAETSYLFAMVGNSSFGSILGKSMGVGDASESLPGKVLMIEYISKKLEETKSKDLLK